MTIKCEVCFRHCLLDEGQTGACFARKNVDGKIIAQNYGMLTAIASDPIEKKPLAHFYPGSQIISVGSYGCNLKCPFCQNVDISWADGKRRNTTIQQFTPKELVTICKDYRRNGNIGIAFTYNEPLVGYEFVRDTAKLVHEAGMKNVLVTNGSVSLAVLDEVGPYIDAMNIDLKCFSKEYYAKTLKGDFETTKAFIRRAAEYSHIELTTLVIPGENDEEEMMRELAAWAAKVGKDSGRDIPLHVSRFFPRSQYAHKMPTDIKKVYRLAEVALEYLKYVHTGNC